MQPKTLSASSIQNFEDCEARYLAESINHVPDVSSSAAIFGTTGHAILEAWVTEGHAREGADFDTMKAILADEWWKYFADRSRYDEMVEMMDGWHKRTGPEDWEERQVISTEVKENFILNAGTKTDAINIPITYIWDRADDLSFGEKKRIEIVDYKTWMQPLKPEDLPNKIQMRIYALSAQMKWKTAEQIWVTLDQTRYNRVSAMFTREDNIETFKYLKQVARRILASDGDKTTINGDCRYCVKRGTCPELLKHVDNGGVLSYMSPDEMADRRAVLKSIMKALDGQLGDLDDALLQHFEDSGITDGMHTPLTEVKIKTRAKRDIDKQRLTKVLGPEFVSKNGVPNMSDLDKLMKGTAITPQQKDQIKSLMRSGRGAPYLETKMKGPFHPKAAS